MANVVFRLFYRVKVYNLDNMPKSGNLILCANHASLLDPIFISIISPRQISWMAKKELFHSKILSFLLNKLGAFPVDRQGSDITAIKNSLRILKDEKVLGIFPEGTRVKSVDLENAKSGVAMLGVRAKSPILPVYIDSTYRLFSPVDIYIGQPLELHEGLNKRPSSEDYVEMSRDILTRIYDLKKMEEGK